MKCLLCCFTSLPLPCCVIRWGPARPSGKSGVTINYGVSNYHGKIPPQTMFQKAKTVMLHEAITSQRCIGFMYLLCSFYDSALFDGHLDFSLLQKVFFYIYWL